MIGWTSSPRFRHKRGRQQFLRVELAIDEALAGPKHRLGRGEGRKGAVGNRRLMKADRAGGGVEARGQELPATLRQRNLAVELRHAGAVAQAQREPALRVDEQERAAPRHVGP